MNQPASRKRLYMLLVFLALVYTLIGLLISFNAGAGSSDAAFEASYKLGADTMSLGVFILITGIPMVLLFLFLYWRNSRINAPRN